VGPKTREISLAGRMAIPGFHDAHTHFIGGALADVALDVNSARSVAGLIAALAAWAERADRPRGDWIVGRGWDADLFSEGRLPNRQDLDAAVADRPVLLRRRDGHAAVANSFALKLAGVDSNTVDPPGGRLERDANGAPTGILLEDPAIDLVGGFVPRVSREHLRDAVKNTLRHAASLGITSIQDDPSYDASLRPGELYADLAKAGDLPARITIWRKLGRPFSELRAEEQALKASGVGHEHVRYGQLKGYLDGSLGSRTAQLFEPYTDDPSAGTGVDLDEAGGLNERVLEAHRAGYQVGLHAIGDRAAARALEAFAACGESAERRHRIEHAQLFRAGDVPRVGAAGVVASVQPIHLASDMVIAVDRLGAERCRNAYPWASLAKGGALLAFGTDFPVEPLDPIPGLVCAVARRSPRKPELPTFEPQEIMTLDAALAAYTTGSARAAHQDATLGRLGEGYLADVAVLSADLRTTPVESWTDVRCDLTIRGGEIVFERSS
jgi:predicted amidohydrolase YtcJ